MKIVSANMRNSGGNDGPNAWPARRATFMSVIAALQPDILGVQEALADQQAELVATLTDFHVVGIARDDGQCKGEYASLFFRRDRFDLQLQSTFWLSEQCDQVGSRGWDAACTRICTWARVRDRQADRELLLANTHLDHVGKVAQIEAARLLRRRLPALAEGSAIVLMGDFNCTEESPVYAELVRSGTDEMWADTFRTIHRQPTDQDGSFHGFTGQRDGARIDWILCSSHLYPTAAGIDHTHSPEGVYPSDHFPIWAELHWR